MKSLDGKVLDAMNSLHNTELAGYAKSLLKSVAA